MRYLLMAIGTRGDVEPFLAVGEKLLERGHEVVATFPAQYEDLAKESGLDFLGFDQAFLDMIEGELGKNVLGGEGNKLKRISDFFKLWKLSTKVNKNIFKQQRAYLEQVNPDFVIHSLKASVPLEWGLKNKGKTILLSPIPCVVHPIKKKSSIGFRGRNLGRILNRWSYSFVTYATIKNLRVYLKKLFKESSSQRKLKEVYLGETAIYTVSPNLLDTSGLPQHVKFLGYIERNKKQHWRPDDKLLAFIERNPKFLFITFGSMSNPKPKEKTKTILKVLEHLNIPAIINTAGGGLEAIEPNSERVHFLENIPYDWILPKAYALVHHGGAGTTHLGVKYGCPSLIIPHIIDQYFWSNTLHELGLGPKGVSIRKMNLEKLESLIDDLWSNKDYHKKSQRLMLKLQEEDFTDSLVKTLENPISALA